ncbi:hypothetical protein PCANC_03341 [Puccinia coronata f. sp. avenae]|uniref:Uncharacterized protein n=1 Tax=Puccinia coronata f. sp. avenae TaxID=200324 RepID=A0A2N5T8T7_9BASI|nr:hypothetical protein PCANC_03341 [Puccinia coronata f. sp. avenae]
MKQEEGIGGPARKPVRPFKRLSIGLHHGHKPASLITQDCERKEAPLLAFLLSPAGSSCPPSTGWVGLAEEMNRIANGMARSQVDVKRPTEPPPRHEYWLSRADQIAMTVEKVCLHPLAVPWPNRREQRSTSPTTTSSTSRIKRSVRRSYVAVVYVPVQPFSPASRSPPHAALRRLSPLRSLGPLLPLRYAPQQCNTIDQSRHAPIGGSSPTIVTPTTNMGTMT